VIALTLIVAVSISCASANTDGAETLDTFSFNVEAANFVNTPVTMFSNCINPPWLSSIGTTQVITRLALGAMLYWLLDGSNIGESQLIITEFAMGVTGGKEKTCHTPAFSIAAARVDRSVVTATVIISLPSY
jgi:23S rRNA G2445 N2-methylase RlmL